VAAVLDLARAFPVLGPDGRYHPELRDLAGRRASGVYAILEGRRVLYVGESHTGRLYDTITRHFRRWKIDPARDALGRRRGGTTYRRGAVRVVYRVTEADTAAALQYAEIERLDPRDNTNAAPGRDAVDLPV